ncbi:MAG: RNA polymerase sigma factor [Steroidobacteraceae bacterium]
MLPKLREQGVLPTRGAPPKVIDDSAGGFDFDSRLSPHRSCGTGHAPAADSTAAAPGMRSSQTRVEGSGVIRDGSTDRAATIDALSRKFRAPLVRFFEKRIGKHAEIDDLVQEVFLHLAGGGRIESVDQPEAYLFRTATNVLYDRRRRLNARAAEVHESFDEAAHCGAQETLDPERAVLGVQAIEQLVAALYELPERTRVIWALYHLEDLAHAEIGRRLGITVSTIEKHMGRASTHLLKRLDR